MMQKRCTDIVGAWRGRVQQLDGRAHIFSAAQSLHTAMSESRTFEPQAQDKGRKGREKNEINISASDDGLLDGLTFQEPRGLIN